MADPVIPGDEGRALLSRLKERIVHLDSFDLGSFPDDEALLRAAVTLIEQRETTEPSIRNRVRLFADDKLRDLFHGWDFDTPGTVGQVRRAILDVVVPRRQSGKPPTGRRKRSGHVFQPRQQNRRSLGQPARCRVCNHPESDPGHIVIAAPPPLAERPQDKG